MSLILIDTSYTSFYRFFATIRWYSLSNPDEFKEKNNNEYDWLTDKLFIEKYEKLYLDSIIKLFGIIIFEDSEVIFCMDSPKKSLWRSDLHCSYKSNRVDLLTKYNYKNVFKYTYDVIIPNILKKYNNITSILIDKVEADDIIGCICMHYKINNPDTTINIISADKDFLQLGGKNVVFLNYKSKEPLIITEEEALLELNKKILLGDKSDCINGILPKGLKKNFKNDLLSNPDKLIDYLDKNNDIKLKYKSNQEIIDFNFIPIIYKKQIINKL